MGTISNFKALPLGNVRVLVILAAILGLLLGLVPAQPAGAFSACLTSLSKKCQIVTQEGCLGVENASLGDLALVKQYSCSTLGDHMFWIINDMNRDGWYEFKNAYSHRCLDVEGGTTANGARLIQYSTDCSPWNRQFRFHTIPETPSWAWIVPRHSSSGTNDKVLDVSASGQVVQWQRVLPYHWDQQFRY